jgi:hypothetical protein
MVDLITNSSSELFIFRKKNTAKAVRDIIVQLAKRYNENAINDGRREGREPWTLDIRHLFKDVFREPVTMTGKYHDKDWGYTVNAGDVIVESADDNSIPWELQEMIETTMNAERHHLG